MSTRHRTTFVCLTVGLFLIGGQSWAQGEDPVPYATACTNARTNGYWWNSSASHLYVTQSYVSSLRVSYSSATSFLSAAQSFYSWVASVSGTSFSWTSNRMVGSVNDVHMVVFAVSGTTCTVEAERVLRKLQPFLSASGTITVASVTYTIPLAVVPEGDPDGGDSLSASPTNYVTDLAEEESVYEECAAEAEMDSYAAESYSDAVEAPYGLLDDCGPTNPAPYPHAFACSDGSDNAAACAACPWSTSHRRRAGIRAWSRNVSVGFGWEERGGEVYYQRKSTADCSTCGSYEDWHTHTDSGAWIAVAFVSPDSSNEELHTGRHHREEISQSGWNLGWQDDDVHAIGKIRSLVSNVWFTTNEGVACDNGDPEC